jgi:hypothetical protein
MAKKGLNKMAKKGVCRLSGFRGEDLKKTKKQPEIRIAYGGHVY